MRPPPHLRVRSGPTQAPASAPGGLRALANKSGSGGGIGGGELEDSLTDRLHHRLLSAGLRPASGLGWVSGGGARGARGLHLHHRLHPAGLRQASGLGWVVAHFGQAPAGSPLNCIALCLLRHAALRGPAAGDLRGASSRSLHGVVWVDDFVFYSQVAWHAACAGLAGGCAWCRSALAEAEALDAWWSELCGLLGVPLNMAKHQCCGQTVEYYGLLFDSFRGPLMLLLPEKLQLLLDHTVELCQVDGAWSPRELDSIHGRLLHYSAAVRHLRILVTEMARMQGPSTEESYDWPGPGPTGLPELATEMRDVLLRYGSAGCPLWPPVASSAYAALLCGEDSEEQALFCSVTWDASTHGWAAVALWWDLLGAEPVKHDLLLVGSWPADWDVSQQPFREALGGSWRLSRLPNRSASAAAAASCATTPRRLSPRSGKAVHSRHPCSAAPFASTASRPRRTWIACPCTSPASPS
jgi:hypothetical protein